MDRPSCPHCSRALQPFLLPDNTGWQTDLHVACFNDECPYYKRGWEWMKTRYNQRASYRHAINPTTGASLPIPVWSESAARDMIVDDVAEGEEE